jgi:hypothetical protein
MPFGKRIERQCWRIDSFGKSLVGTVAWLWFAGGTAFAVLYQLGFRLRGLDSQKSSHA